METKRAIEIVQLLADGINPYTGEVMETDSVFQNPDTIRALYVALEKLRASESRRERNMDLPGNTGKSWAPEEDASLKEEFDSGMDILAMAKKHERTRWAIQSRLMKLGKIQFF